MQKIRYYHDGVEIDEQDAFQNGALRDGVSARVPTMMRDSLRPLRRAAATRGPDRPALLTDAFGNPSGHRPGFVFNNDRSALDAKRAAYEHYERGIQNAWRDQPKDDEDNSSGSIAAGLENPCKAVSPGSAVRDHSRIMQGIYDAYDAELAQRWRHE